jgi:hypothetical protein
MKFLILVFAISAALATAQPAAKSAGPQFDSESLNYNVNWPSGLSLGEAQLSAQKTDTGWSFAFQLDASVPGFAVLDRFRSAASRDLCSASFDKEVSHGKRKSKEKITFDSSLSIATRQTLGGGKGEMPTPSCARDALAYLYHVRTELAQGRIPGAYAQWRRSEDASFRVSIRAGTALSPSAFTWRATSGRSAPP